MIPLWASFDLRVSRRIPATVRSAERTKLSQKTRRSDHQNQLIVERPPKMTLEMATTIRAVLDFIKMPPWS
jgi:hypothetical protein